MDNTYKIAWWGYQTNLGKTNLLKKYYPTYERGEKPSEKEIEYIYDNEH